jgi:hypothetical protein
MGRQAALGVPGTPRGPHGCAEPCDQARAPVQACRGEVCQRFARRVYREGYRCGHDEGEVKGEAGGHARGYSEGWAGGYVAGAAAAAKE